MEPIMKRFATALFVLAAVATTLGLMLVVGMLRQ